MHLLEFECTKRLKHIVRLSLQLCPYNVELGNQGMETQIFAFDQSIDVSSEYHFTENMCYLFDTQKLDSLGPPESFRLSTAPEYGIIFHTSGGLWLMKAT